MTGRMCSPSLLTVVVSRRCSRMIPGGELESYLVFLECSVWAQWFARSWVLQVRGEEGGTRAGLTYVGASQLRSRPSPFPPRSSTPRATKKTRPIPTFSSLSCS